MVEKIRPRAHIEWTDGNDGRDGHYFISYYCAGCGRNVREGVVACENCGTFHDWSKKANIVVKRIIEWG